MSTTKISALPAATTLTGAELLPVVQSGVTSQSTTALPITILTGTLATSHGGTGLTSLGTGVATYLGTPTFANLLSATSGIAASGANTDITSATVPLLIPTGNALEQRNGANAQNFYLYSTYTNASTYARLRLQTGSGFVQIAAEENSSGTTPDLYLNSTTGSVLLRSVNVTRWTVNTSGHFLAATDNTNDIGASGATRPRDIYAGTSVRGAFVSTGTATTCTGATIGAGSKSNAGFVTATTTGTSTIVITFPVTAPTRWNVHMTDETTAVDANAVTQTAGTATTATLVGTTVSGDVLSYVAMAY